MNVIGSRPDGWWRDRRGAMRRLIESLEGFADETGERVTVVLDGRFFELDGGPVEVMFASRRGRDAADDDIASLVERADDPGAIRVVTSDAELERRVRAAGGDVVGAGEFRRRIEPG